MKVKAIKTKIFREGDNLVKFIVDHLPHLKDGLILTVTSKIVALSEKRTVPYTTPEAKEKLVKAQSTWVARTSYGWSTLKDGMLVSSAGIDESNGSGKLILLPKDSYSIASKLRKKLMRIYKVKNLGVIVVDSRVAPLRAGVLGMALGYAGFAGLRDYRGKPDIFGRRFKVTRTNVADSLATTCVLVMGEGNEQCPLALVSNAPVEFQSKINPKEMKINIRLDIYGPLFKKFASI